MQREGIDVLIATSPENVTYCSDYDSPQIYRYKGLQAYAILPQNFEQASLIVPKSELAYLMDRPSWIKDIRMYGTFNVFGLDQKQNIDPQINELINAFKNVPHSPSVTDLLIMTLREKNLLKPGIRIGVDELNLSVTSKAALEEYYGQGKIIYCSNLFKEIRMVKSEEEIKRLKECASINQKAIKEMISSMRPGITERDLRNIYIKSIIEDDAMFGHWSTSCGPRSMALYPESDYMLKTGDISRIDMGCVYKGYWSDMARSVSIGEPTKKCLKYYEALKQGLLEACSMVKAGVYVSEIFKKGVEIVQNEIVEYKRHMIGHSIGLEHYEPPMVMEKGAKADIFLAGITDMKLEEGMVINIEFPYYEAGLGGLTVENTMLVTKAGFELFTDLDTDLFIINA